MLVVDAFQERFLLLGKYVGYKKNEQVQNQKKKLILIDTQFKNRSRQCIEIKLGKHLLQILESICQSGRPEGDPRKGNQMECD